MITKSKVKSQKLKLFTWIQSFVFCIAILHFAFCILNFNCYAEPISSTELIQDSQQYDGKEVIFKGEVIGEVMPRGDGVWVNINDGENSIGIWMPHELAAAIEYRGGYNVKGDILEIKGIFNRACVQHGGDLDIHAISLEKIKSGWQKQDKIILAKRNLLIILTVILCLILILKISIIK